MAYNYDHFGSDNRESYHESSAENPFDEDFLSFFEQKFSGSSTAFQQGIEDLQRQTQEMLRKAQPKTQITNTSVTEETTIRLKAAKTIKYYRDSYDAQTGVTTVTAIKHQPKRRAASFLIFPEGKIKKLEELQYKRQRIYRDILQVPKSTFDRWVRVLSENCPHWSYYQYWDVQQAGRVRVEIYQPQKALTLYHIWLLKIIQNREGGWHKGNNLATWIRQHNDEFTFDKWHRLIQKVGNGNIFFFLDHNPCPCSLGKLF